MQPNSEVEELRQQVAEMERERCPHDEASISAMAADYQEQIAVLAAELADTKVAMELYAAESDAFCERVKVLTAERNQAREKVANLKDWIVAAHQFMWAHEKTCPRHDADLPCDCGLDEFLGRPRPFIEGHKARIATLEASRDAAVERIGVLEGVLRRMVDAVGCCTCQPFWDKYGRRDPNCAFHDCESEIIAARAALSTAAPAAPPAIQGTPLAEVDPFFCVWRCSCCGDMNDNIRDTRWRWDGEAWEHACGGPQDGHYPARNFGPHPDAAAPTKTEEPR